MLFMYNNVDGFCKSRSRDILKSLSESMTSRQLRQSSFFPDSINRNQTAAILSYNALLSLQ